MSAEPSPESSSSPPATGESVALPVGEPSTSVGTEGGVFRVPEVPPVKEPTSPEAMTPDDDLDDETYVPSEPSSSTITTPGDMEMLPTAEREQVARGEPRSRLMSSESSSSGHSSTEAMAGSSGTATVCTTPFTPSTAGQPLMECELLSPADLPLDPVSEPPADVLSGMTATEVDSAAKRRRAAFATTPDAAVMVPTQGIDPSAPPPCPHVPQPGQPCKLCAPKAFQPRDKLHLDLRKFEPAPSLDVDFSPMDEDDSGSVDAPSASASRPRRESEEKEDSNTGLKDD